MLDAEFSKKRFLLLTLKLADLCLKTGADVDDTRSFLIGNSLKSHIIFVVGKVAADRILIDIGNINDRLCGKQRHVAQNFKLLRRVVGSSAQKHDAPQPLLPLHHSPPLDLVIAGADLLHHHGKALGGDAVLDGPDDVGIEGVGHAPHHQSNGVGLGLDQIPCGVVGDVVGTFNDLQHPASVLLADVRSVIEHTGYRADADAAEPGNIFDGHR